MGKPESLKSCIEYNIQYRKRSKRTFQYSINSYNTKRNRKEYSDAAAQQRAAYLADKFHNPSGLRFYLKVAWNLTDQYIDWLVAYAFRKKDPSRYFVAVAARKLLENN